MMKHHPFTLWRAGILFVAPLWVSCSTSAPDASSVKAPTTYEYYVDSDTGKPYSPLYEAGPVRYVIQFPGYNPYDAFLYGRDFVAYLSVESKEPYAVRNLRLRLKRDGREVFPPKSSYLTDSRIWKLNTVIVRQSDSPGGIDFHPAKKNLTGFVYQRAQLDGRAVTELEVSFDLIVGDTRTPIRRSFSLKRTATSEVTGEDPRVRERKPGECVLVGPWWIERENKDMADEHDSCARRAIANEDCAIRVSGRGFLPRLRYDRIHFEGFFMHVDHKNRKPGWWILWLLEELTPSSNENPW